MNYDTLKIVLTNEYDLSVNFLDRIPESLIVRTKGVNQSGAFINGNLKNLFVRINSSTIRIEGSLHIFFSEENLSPFSFNDMVKAITMLKEMLNLPIEEGRLARFDFSGNIILRYSVEAYLPYFGAKSRHRRLDHDNGIYYKTDERVLLFYDKIKAMKNKRETIPEYFEGKNILRFEMRFMSKLAKHFNVQELKVSHLLEPSFFNDLCLLWRKEYRSIQKNINSITGLLPTGSKPKLIEDLAIMQIQQMGIENFLDEIKVWQSTGKITKKEAYDHRKFIKGKAAEKYPLAENELIQELNQKIKVAARYEV